MVHSLMSERNLQHHVNQLLSPAEMRNHLDQARIERSKAFKGMVGAVNSSIRKFVVTVGR